MGAIERRAATPSPRLAAAFATAAALAAAAGCGPARPARPPNLLLVTVDTLRADHLDAWGDRAVDTPAIDALAADGLVFERAWTTIPITTPALASVMTSLWPRNHGTLGNAYDVGSANETLPRLLESAGYRTGAFLPSWLADKRGFRAGFEVYDFPSPPGPDLRPGAEVVERALAWLAETEAAGPRPWFCWIHLLEPHSPYRATPELERKHLPEGVGTIDPALRHETLREAVARTPEEVAILRALYRADVELADLALAPLFRWVREHAPEGTLAAEGEVVTLFTADHGEMLYEHERYVGHTSWLYEEMLRVPLVLHWTSGRHAGERSPFPAVLLDVMPTLAALAGIEWESPDGGLDLVGRFEDVDRLLVHETFAPEGAFHQQAVRLGEQKLLRGVDETGGRRPDRARFFDLRSDSAERLDVAPDLSDRVAAFEALFDDWRADQADPDGWARPELDEEARQRLEELGYLTEPVDPEDGSAEDGG